MRAADSRVLLGEGFHDEAIGALRTLIDDHPDLLEAYDLLAECLRRTGKPTQAQRAHRLDSIRRLPFSIRGHLASLDHPWTHESCCMLALSIMTFVACWQCLSSNIA